jgi:hypothetical protein
MLEESLRETFKDRADALPMVDDPATGVIRRARRVRLRQSAVRGLAAVLVLAGLMGGSLQLRHWWQEPAGTGGVHSPILPPAEPIHDRQPVAGVEPWDGGEMGLQVRVVNRVWTPTGERLLLRGSALVEQAYQTPYGLLYGNEREVRLRRHGGAVVDVLADSGHWLVSPDGERVAAVADGVLRVVQLGPAGVAGEPAVAQVAAESRPVAFWGTRVVISGPADGFDLWDPASGYEPAWNSRIVAVYGQVGADLLVLVGAPDGYCLATVPAGASRPDPDLTTGQCEQPLPVTRDGFGWLAPGGGWLALPDGDRLRLVEVTGSSGEPTKVSCPRQEWKTPTWWNPTTLLSADRNGAVSCDVRGAVTRVELPDQAGRLWEFVPALGSGR